jgi:hypothetical protein
MSAYKYDGALTPEKYDSALTAEKIQKAYEIAISRWSGMYGEHTMRIISYPAHQMLNLIQGKLPNWDGWNTEPEIWFKARSMGLLDEE